MINLDSSIHFCSRLESCTLQASSTEFQENELSATSEIPLKTLIKHIRQSFKRPKNKQYYFSDNKEKAPLKKHNRPRTGLFKTHLIDFACDYPLENIH